MTSRRWKQLGLALGGFALGLLFVLVGVYVYFRSVADYQLAEGLLRTINLPRESFELEEVEGDSAAVLAVRDVVIRARGGDTIVAAPVVRFRLGLASLGGEGPIVLDQVRVLEPYLNLIQQQNGDLNLAQVAVTAGGREVETEEGRTIVLRDVRIEDGRVRLVTPFEPDSLPIREDQRARIRLVRSEGQAMRVRWVRGLDARLPRVRFGGEEGWRVEVASLSARLSDPDVQVLALAGFAEETAEGFRFDLDTFRTDDSQLTAAGTVGLGGETLAYDVEVRAASVAFADLQWVAPALPARGRVAGVFRFESQPAERVLVQGREVVVTALDSRVAGSFSALVGGGAPASFWSTRLSLEPLRLETLAALGLDIPLPYTGEVRGLVTSEAESPGASDALRVDVTASFQPEDGGVPTSTVLVQGPVVLGGPDAMIRFQGVQVALQPLHLAALRPLVDAQPERLRGIARGAFLVTGTPSSLVVENGTLAYEVGDAPISRLLDLRLQLDTEPELSFSFAAQAQPLALATLSELFPAMPFRTARFSGPIRVEGTLEQMRVNAELAGSAGMIALQGLVFPGAPLRFDLSGRVSAFSPDAVLTRPVPVEGPVTGTFAAAGTAEDFRFNVDLAQEGGSFALQGRFRSQGDAAPVFEVAGNVSNFNLGAAIGRPRLFPSRMTGRVDLRGGAGAPYRFDVDLRGDGGELDVEGFFSPGAVPEYAISGTVTGLNLRQLPGGAALPQTDLRGQINLRGRGATLATLSGELQFSGTGSTVAGIRVETLRADLAVRDGVLAVDTLVATLAGSRLNAAGTLGLTRPVTTDPLQFRVVGRNLNRLTPLLGADPGLQPQVTGSFVLQGTLSGSVQQPLVTASFRGQNLRYEAWRAARLEFDTEFQLAQGVEQIQGELSLVGDELALGGALTLDSLRLRLQGTQDRMAVQLAATRESASDIQVAGVLELEGRVPHGVLLDSLTLRAGDIAWRLQNPAAVRWGGVEGVRVDDLFLRRVGEERGSILVDGSIPPSGTADLRLTVNELDLEVVRRLLPTDPRLGGVVTLEARLEGSTADPELFVQGRGTAVQYRGVELDSVLLSARYNEGRMQSTATLWRETLRMAEVEALVPMRLSVASGIPEFELIRNQTMRARLVADSLPVALLTATFPQVEDGAGHLAGEAVLFGTMERPELSGFATVQDGALTLRQLGVRYERISGRLILDEQTILVDTLTVWSDGRAVVSGSIRLDNLERPDLYLTAEMFSFHAIQNEQIADLTLSGTVALTGRMPEPVLSGRVAVQQGVIYIPTLDERAPLEIANVDVGQIGADTSVIAGVGPSLPERIRISELNVLVEEGVWLESDNARVQIRGELVVVRTGQEPRIYGTLQAVRGRYALTIGPLVREFEVQSGSIRFFGTPDFNPELDITAAHDVRALGTAAGAAELTILVRVTGTLEYPRISLTSNTRPPLPESELLSWLVFGQPSFRLNETTGAFAQQVLVQELLGGLLVQELGQLGLPCQYFRVRGRPNLLNSDPLRSTSVECGVQLLEDLFLTVETGVIPGVTGGNTGLLAALLGVSLDWEVNRFVTARLAREPVHTGIRTMILTPVEVRYQWSADVKGTWEFGRPSNHGTENLMPLDEDRPPAPPVPPEE